MLATLSAKLSSLNLPENTESYYCDIYQNKKVNINNCLYGHLVTFGFIMASTELSMFVSKT